MTDLPGVLLATEAIAVNSVPGAAASMGGFFCICVGGCLGGMEAELVVFNNGGAAAGVVELECRVERIDGWNAFLDRTDGSDSREGPVLLPAPAV